MTHTDGMTENNGGDSRGSPGGHVAQLLAVMECNWKLHNVLSDPHSSYVFAIYLPNTDISSYCNFTIIISLLSTQNIYCMSWPVNLA